MDSVNVDTKVMLPFTHEVNSAGAHSTEAWAYDDADGAVTVTVKAPPGQTSTVAKTYTYLTDSELTKDATGKYTLTIIPDKPGIWTWYPRAAGTADPGRDRRRLQVVDVAP